MPSRFLNRGVSAGLRVPTVAAVLAIAATAPMQSVSAQSRDRGPLLGLPAASVEAAPAGAAISEAPYQRSVRLTCNSNNTTCTGRLPPVRTGDRLAIQFVSCRADMALESELRYIYMLVTDAQVTKQLGLHFVAPTYRSAAEPFYYVASQPMLLAAASGNIVHLVATTLPGRLAGVECGVSGVRQMFR